MSVLAEIVGDVRARVKQQARLRPIESMELKDFSRRSLCGAIERAPNVALIAEIKRASPSAGDIRPGADVCGLAGAMVRGGAVALSVLTEPRYFKGDPSFLHELMGIVEVPLLRKDFIVDKYQLYESAELGADAVLLIVKVIGKELPSFMSLAEELGMESLVEVTNEPELEIATATGAELIGINNRDFETLEIDLDRTRRLAPRVPEGVTLVSESGISSPDDVRAMLEAGADAVLVGTALMLASDVEGKVRSLVNVR